MHRDKTFGSYFLRALTNENIPIWPRKRHLSSDIVTLLLGIRETKNCSGKSKYNNQ